MKTLIFINGPMGVGKTAVCRELLERLTPGVYLDGDWCWNMNPFQVTDETKSMVMQFRELMEDPGSLNWSALSVPGLPRAGLRDLRLGHASA